MHDQEFENNDSHCLQNDGIINFLALIELNDDFLYRFKADGAAFLTLQNSEMLKKKLSSNNADSSSRLQKINEVIERAHGPLDSVSYSHLNARRLSIFYP